MNDNIGPFIIIIRQQLYYTLDSHILIAHTYIYLYFFLDAILSEKAPLRVVGQKLSA